MGNSNCGTGFFGGVYDYGVLGLLRLVLRHAATGEDLPGHNNALYVPETSGTGREYFATAIQDLTNLEGQNGLGQATDHVSACHGLSAHAERALGSCTGSGKHDYIKPLM